MSYLQLVILCFVSFITVQQAVADSLQSKTIPESINQLLHLPENKIDIGIAALTFAKDVYPDLDIKKYSAKIDRMVKEAKEFTGKSNDPEYKKRALNTYLFRDYKLEYDYADPHAQKLENRYINGLLDRKKGSCTTMPLLYMAIAQRMGYPVYPVTTPDHNFLRYVDPRLKKQNIEATSNGGWSPDETIIEELEVSEEGIKSGAYMRTLSYHEYLANLLVLNANYWAEREDLAKAFVYIMKATDINPKDANHFEALAMTMYRISKRARTPLDTERFRDDAMWYHDIAIDLGFVRISREGREKYEEHAKKKLAAKNKSKRKDSSQ
jgi:regulator of sirC expression with transglutaminase-like and TPR domain